MSESKSRKRKGAADAPAPLAVPVPGEPHPFLASAQSRELSEFEFSLIILMFGFQRWVVNCMEAAQFRGLGALDILVLHAVNHRARGRRISEICMVLNIDDTHLVAYALKKLVAAALVKSTTQGRERHYETTATGDQACMAYRKVREQFLIPSLSWLSGERNVVRDAGAFMRAMTAIYDQAGRFATAESTAAPTPPLRTK
ncbi:MAG TPA: winged helix DNA-binding protein [Casimicrobiaceae bacterium]|nr:winged helix DNA-binding protein [Casimicrobiaceae bacterium]